MFVARKSSILLSQNLTYSSPLKFSSCVRRHDLQISQALLWENEKEARGQGLCYGCSQHYHYVAVLQDPKSYSGSMMVHSMVTETLANVSVRRYLKAVEIGFISFYKILFYIAPVKDGAYITRMLRT